MKCPRCGGWLGMRRIVKAVPGRPFACPKCARLLKIGVLEAAKRIFAGLVIVFGPMYVIPPPYGVLWLLAAGAGAFYWYARLAQPFDPAETLSYPAGGGLFELLPQGVRYRGELHPYSAITHIDRYARSTVILHVIPIEDYLRVRVHLQGGSQPIQLENKSGLLFSAAPLREVYERLAERTFTHRGRAYLMQLERHGYFEYGGARFHRSGEVAIGDAKLDLRTAKLSFEPFKLVLDPPGMFNRKRRIEAETDQDILFALLGKVYGISFKA
jgi:hypothetical protein